MDQPIFRFAPSPNGLLHLGHAYSALVAQKICKSMGGRMLLRIEDIDTNRCRPEFEAAIIEDLYWLGFQWEPWGRVEGGILRQSQNLEHYIDILNDLQHAGLVYPTFLSRSDIRQKVDAWENSNGKLWPNDPDGAPFYPGEERSMKAKPLELFALEQPDHTLRLDVEKAVNHIGGTANLFWNEFTPTYNDSNISFDKIHANPREWGDVVLGRRDIKTSYHLACVIDDAAQGITHIVRGKDLYAATSVHCLIQQILGYPDIAYHHHELIVDDGGDKLSKHRNDTSIRQLRDAGTSVEDVYRMIGLTL